MDGSSWVVWLVEEAGQAKTDQTQQTWLALGEMRG
jgi:hypothetical protein